MDSPQDLMRINLALIQRIVARACRRGGLEGAEAEDFASEVMVALIENNYAVIRKFEGRSSFGGFIAAVVEHRMINRIVSERGKWNASAEAERLGEAAVALERLIYRDGRPLDAALPFVRTIDPAITRASAEAMLARLPVRTTRPRAVDLDAVSPDAFPSPERADERALATEATKKAGDASRIVRAHLDALPPDDRTLIRLRFGAGMTLADIARTLRVPQRPLYRRLETVLGKLRTVLQACRIDDATAAELIAVSGEIPLDFGFDEWKNTPANLSSSEEPR